MPDTPSLRPATPDEIADPLSFALRFNGKKRARDADEMMARITAERLSRFRLAAQRIRGRGSAAFLAQGLAAHPRSVGQAANLCLERHLTVSGFVVMKEPPSQLPSIPKTATPDKL